MLEAGIEIDILTFSLSWSIHSSSVAPGQAEPETGTEHVYLGFHFPSPYSSQHVISLLPSFIVRAGQKWAMSRTLPHSTCKLPADITEAVEKPFPVSNSILVVTAGWFWAESNCVIGAKITVLSRSFRRRFDHCTPASQFRALSYCAACDKCE